ncbi:MAG: hypothetical protein AVO35_04375 [Candidatus Aegiribacteria sp. MLS_C]|nr:MAG: hypothetical protein AVO35_04375 [Candidatus Aegiribacteria sp. MLS_C]
MDSLKLPLIVLICVLAAALSVTLVTADTLSRRLGTLHMQYGYADSRIREITSQRDTLAGIHRFCTMRADSLEMMCRRADSLEARLQMLELRNDYVGYYLLIDTYQNRFHLRRNLEDGTDIMVRSGYCGTGKGWTSNENGRVWDFSTPRGLRYVVRKGENPYWYRPDWYWEEMDMTPPEPEEYIVIPDTIPWEDQIAYYNDSLSAGERLFVQRVPGALGSYKLDLGGGILIHYGVGRGMNVSHGCIRIGSADLEALYRTLPVGAPVVIY